MLNDIAKRFLSRTADHPAEEDTDSMPVEERENDCIKGIS